MPATQPTRRLPHPGCAASFRAAGRGPHSAAFAQWGWRVGFCPAVQLPAPSCPPVIELDNTNRTPAQSTTIPHWGVGGRGAPRTKVPSRSRAQSSVLGALLRSIQPLTNVWFDGSRHRAVP